MKKIIAAAIFLWIAGTAFAQQDSSKSRLDTSFVVVRDTVSINSPDTIRVGNFVIIKRNKNGEQTTQKGRSITVIIRSGSHRDTTVSTRKSAFSTNWLIADIGFANYNDRTNYNSVAGDSYLNTAPTGAPYTKGDLKLLTKSSNVNIWLFMQKLNIAKRAINLKYGFGLEMFNFRYDNNISYNKSPAYIYRDTINFSKDKLYTAYASVPMMLNINPWPDKKRISFSVGASAGYLIGSHTKQKSDEQGKEKVRGDFDLNKWRFAYVGELALGPVRFYGSYSIQPLHDHTLKQYPYTIGVRLSNW